ncbi:hypothetical protein UFOVP777_21 [uncultured Caudovirales phage]|uniref:Uncharacterized protein n=1 Tax=uncultured Caudovirales phage TaxID=2100421 RepID=A0A6J5NYQ5_9CAUD|nr:hypothetical protein UFOVP777_21 [uncultured Caudovirales phage]
MTPEVIQAILATLTAIGAVWVATLKYQANQSKKELDTEKEQAKRAELEAAAKLAAQQTAFAKELNLQKDLEQRFGEVLKLVSSVRDEVHQLSSRIDQVCVRLGSVEAHCNSCTDANTQLAVRR